MAPPRWYASHRVKFKNPPTPFLNLMPKQNSFSLPLSETCFQLHTTNSLFNLVSNVERKDKESQRRRTSSFCALSRANSKFTASFTGDFVHSPNFSMSSSFNPSQRPGSSWHQLGSVDGVSRLRSLSVKKPTEPLRQAVANCLSSLAAASGSSAAMLHHGCPSAAFLFEDSRTSLVRNFCEFQNLGLIWLRFVL